MKSHLASGPRLGLASGRDEDDAARARRTALLLFEQRRSQLAAGLRRPKRPRRRYEDLRLATALGRAESHCLVKPGGRAQAPVDECLIAGLELQLVSMQESLDRMERWLSPETRQRADSEAEERFRTIAREVRTELVTQGLVRPARDSASEAGGAAAARCTATTLKGARCKNRAKANGVCRVHARLENSPAALPAAPAPARSEPTTIDPSAVDPVAVSVYVARLRALSESFGRDPVPVPDLAAIRAWLPSLDLAATRARVRALAPAKPELRLPRLELAAWRSRLPAWPERDRLDASHTWALGGSVALAAAAALIWSGVAENGSHAPGGEVDIASASNLPALPVSSAGSETISSQDATAPARAPRSDPPDEGGSRRVAEAGAGGEPAEPSLREPGATSVAPDAGPSGSGGSEEPTPAPAPAPAPVPEPAPEPGGGPVGGPVGEAPDSPEPEPSPPPSLTDTVNDVVSDLTKTAGDALDRLPLVGAP